MRFSARSFIAAFCLSLVTFFFSASATFAQTAVSSSYPPPNTANSYNMPDTDPNVPANQHTRVQTLMIDIMAASVCLLAGIDPVDPSKPCLDVNPQTGKIGYSQSSFDENGRVRLGGLAGASSQMIGMLYTPTISGQQYTQYLAQNFGIVKPAYAQEPGYGFQGLNVLLSLWIAIRNMAYFLLMIAFVIIGLGIMLRIEVAPRTIMTLQNQIPRIVVCIILVTFSFSIAGFMIDAMWLSTYVGINVITSAGGGSGSSATNPTIPGNKNLSETDPNYKDGYLSEVATLNLLQSPLTYVNNVFRVREDTDPNNDDIDIGIKTITLEVSASIGSFLRELLEQVLGVKEGEKCFSFTGGVVWNACFAGVLGFIARWLIFLIILITVLKTLFSVWFTLIKAYTYVIIYSIAGPFFIVLGLLPGKPLGVEKWIRALLANLAVFPATACLFVLARLFIDLYNTEPTAAAGTSIAAAGDANRFIPPLIGNPDIAGLFGVLIAFGLILMSPTVLTILQESLKVTGTKHGSAIGAGLAAGAAAPKAGFGAMWNQATRNTKLHEHDAGWLRQVAAGKGNKFGTEKFSIKNPKSWVDTIQKQRGKLVRFGGKASGH